MSKISLFAPLFVIFIIQSVSGAALDQFLSDSPCESHCGETLSDSPELIKSCSEGCRLFKIIGLAKGFTNKTIGLCFSACGEAFTNETIAGACNYGCRQEDETKSKDEPQSLHLLTPMFYIKNTYNTMTHHIKQFVSSSLTVYVQEDSGNMVVLQTKPKIERMEDVRARQQEEERRNYLRNFKPPWEAEKIDWMDCISHQSGIPRWLLVVVLFGFILALIWLCCATAVTAPNQYLGSPKQEPKRNIHYVLVSEPDIGEMKAPGPLVNSDEDAPPLPPKVSLI